MNENKSINGDRAPGVWAVWVDPGEGDAPWISSIHDTELDALREANTTSSSRFASYVEFGQDVFETT